MATFHHSLHLYLITIIFLVSNEKIELGLYIDWSTLHLVESFQLCCIFIPEKGYYVNHLLVEKDFLKHFHIFKSKKRTQKIKIYIL